MDNNPANLSLLTGCNTDYIPLEPVYLNIRKETLNHLGIGDPLDPTNYALITPKIMGFCNDVNDPFTRVFRERITVPYEIDSPCNPNDPKISVNLDLDKVIGVASSTYAPVLYGAGNIGLLAGDRKFVGIDQVIAYVSPSDPYPTSLNLDITFKLQNGTPPNGNIGYIFVTFAPDDLDEPNGHGTYFFKILPSAKIKVI
ncbi:MAG: hypothetical protein ACRC3Y_04230 [Romboutsia sp.]|uniref:hypothetical protein n=1 Tax=Romboutsia sp. TaxID=1965302 RepID=UPI003F3D4535